jgi:hypothetical protein
MRQCRPVVPNAQGDAVVLIEGTCSFGGGFLRRSCGQPAAGQCVYCGEKFCPDHGEHLENYHEICARPECRKKYDDVNYHRLWIEAHRPRNAVSVCAEDGCEERMQHECQRCKLRFCPDHLHQRHIPERNAQGKAIRVMRIVCEHCAERRRIWDS